MNAMNEAPDGMLQAQLERYANDFGNLAAAHHDLLLKVHHLQSAIAVEAEPGQHYRRLKETFDGFFVLATDEHGRVQPGRVLPRRWPDWESPLAPGRRLWDFIAGFCAGDSSELRHCRRDASGSPRGFRCLSRDGCQIMIDVYRFEDATESGRHWWLLCPSRGDSVTDAADQGNLFLRAEKAVMLCDAEGRIRTANAAFEHVTGYPLERVIGANPRILRSDRHQEDFFSGMWKDLKQHGEWRGELWNRHADGHDYPLWMRILAFRSGVDEVEGYLAVFCDASPFKGMAQRVDHLARFDTLTGLGSRRLFMERLAAELAQARGERRGLAVLYLDLAQFRAVNASLGHAVGDQVLSRFAQRLRSAVRATDTLARLGGDEFAVLLANGADRVSAERVTRTITNDLNRPCRIDDKVAYLRARIGIACFPRDGNTPSTLLHNAELAMQRARQEGRAFAVFAADMDELNGRMKLSLLLHRAITDFRPFRVVYQPQVQAGTGRIIGAEALLRLHDPQEGPISPESFIPVAEQEGLIRSLDAWVLRRVCRQIKAWADMGLPVRVAVNVSASELGDADFATRVGEIITQEEVAPASVELEITESAAMADHGACTLSLASLRHSGISLSIDDFGTGHSSLARLRDLRFNRVKIDRSFVENMTLVNRDLELVRAVLSLTAALGLKSVAEGVEHLDQLNALCRMGCNEIQGYLYSRPVSADEMTALLRQGTISPVPRKVHAARDEDPS